MIPFGLGRGAILSRPPEWAQPWADEKERGRTGFFLTIWKRQPDGTWRYVMDNGAPDKPAPKSEAPKAN
jgi:hypothetical protein